MSTHERYSRQLTLPGWGQSGQQRLADATGLIVGLGGLGVPAATYLAAAGIGNLVLNDFDDVDATNLPRQPLYTDEDIGYKKAEIAASRLAAVNPGCTLRAVTDRLRPDQIHQLVETSDVVLDCSDNFTTRFNVNSACVNTGIPLVSGAAIRGEAQLAVFRYDLEKSPCYRCLYDEAGEELENCRGQGVLPALVGMIGAAMALEAMRVLVGFGKVMRSTLVVYDAYNLQGRTLALPADPACPVCAAADRPDRAPLVRNIFKKDA